MGQGPAGRFCDTVADTNGSTIGMLLSFDEGYVQKS